MESFSMVALALLSYWLFRLVAFFWYMTRCYVLTLFGFTLDLKGFGKWAIVTGATDGIGKCYAQELAKRGLNIVLISRTGEKLNRVAKEIEAEFSVETKCIVFDFSTPAGYATVEKELIDLDVGVLVNNVGTTGSATTLLYDQLDIKEHLKVLHTNLLGEVHLTHMVLPGMIAKKKGVIIHVSSSFGYLPLGMISLYSPTKAFVNAFTANLQKESEVMKDIHHQLVTPFFVVTNMTSKYVKKGIFFPDAPQFVSMALRTLGIAKHTYGCWSHELLGGIITVCPQFLLEMSPMAKGFAKRCSLKRINKPKKVE